MQCGFFDRLSDGERSRRGNVKEIVRKIKGVFQGERIQDYYENREIEETLDLAWDLLKILPENELDRLSPEMIKQHMNR